MTPQSLILGACDGECGQLGVARHTRIADDMEKLYMSQVAASTTAKTATSMTIPTTTSTTASTTAATTASTTAATATSTTVQ